MSRSITPYLQLVRLPNVITAAADSLAGWLLVGGTLAEPARWVPLSMASMVLYAAGMALNDYFDIEIDREERPGRPLPSRRISPAFAAGLGAAGLVLGPILASLAGSFSGLSVALLLAAAILAYDLGLKRTFMGPEVMGACRGLNLLLGMTRSPSLGGPVGWLAAGCFGLFVAGLTWISRSETQAGRSGNLLSGLAIQNASLLGLMAVALHPREFPSPPTDARIIPMEGLLVLAVVAMAVNLATSRAIHQPVPSLVQRTVKVGILSLVWIDVGLVAAVRGPLPAMAIALLWLPAFLLGRWLYST
jgi:4-hydroxybenzoate polyprenyltransferase